MKIAIEKNNDILAKAKKLSGIEDEKVLIENALRLFITIGNQKRLKDLYGKVALDDEAFK